MESASHATPPWHTLTLPCPITPWSNLQPEMCNDVQKYDKQVYLRVSEAQRCRVHSTLVMPVFDGAGGMMDDDDGCARRGQRAVAVFEVVQSERDVMFPEMMGWLRACLEVRVAVLHWHGAGERSWDAWQSKVVQQER